MAKKETLKEEYNPKLNNNFYRKYLDDLHFYEGAKAIGTLPIEKRAEQTGLIQLIVKAITNSDTPEDVIEKIKEKNLELLKKEPNQTIPLWSLDEIKAIVALCPNNPFLNKLLQNASVKLVIRSYFQAVQVYNEYHGKWDEKISFILGDIKREGGDIKSLKSWYKANS